MPQTPSAAQRGDRPDAFGVFAYAVYVAVGGLLVFMFAWSIRGAVDTQNASVCRALTPEFRTRVQGTVVRDGTPVAGATINPDDQGVGGVVTAEDGSFTLMLDAGVHQVAVLESGVPDEAVLVPLTVEGGRDVAVSFELAAASATVQSDGVFVAPEIVAEDLEGNEVKLSDFRGKLVIVNFWATWCEPCITEWPQLDQLAARLGDRDDVMILAVSTDEEKDKIQPFLERMSLDESQVKVVWDPTGEVHRAYGGDKIPDTFFVDEQGNLAAAFVNVRKWGNPEAFHCVDGSVGLAAG